MMINTEIERRLSDYFDKTPNNNNNYYVYALYDGSEPFYIGKGTGDRVLQHEKDLENELNQANENEKSELRAKLDRIKQAKKKNCFKQVIIKHGLSEHEAFMAESALINIMKYQGSTLTNIVNGHASEKEKESGKEEPLTMAFEIDEFVEHYCPESISYDDFEKNINDPVVLISIRELYKYCKDDNDVKDAVRGNWAMDTKKINEKKPYVFAVVNGMVKGIYKVNAARKVEDDPVNAPEHIFGSSNRISEAEIYEEAKKCSCNPENIKEEFIKYGINELRWDKNNLKESIKKALKRTYFDFENNDDKQLKELKQKYLNKYIEGLKIPQRSFKYLNMQKQK